MKKIFNNLTAIAVVTAATFFISCKNDGGYGGKPPNPPDNVNAVVKSAAVEFRAPAGDPLNTAPGTTSGGRGINWEGVPGALANANKFPLEFFWSL